MANRKTRAHISPVLRPTRGDGLGPQTQNTAFAVSFPCLRSAVSNRNRNPIRRRKQVAQPPSSGVLVPSWALGATPKRSLSVSSRVWERTLKQVWAWHPSPQFLRSEAGRARQSTTGDRGTCEMRHEAPADRSRRALSFNHRRPATGPARASSDAYAETQMCLRR